MINKRNFVGKKSKDDEKESKEDSKEEIEPEKDIKFDGSMLFSSFYDVLKYSNFFVLKCYKLVFSFQGQKHNWGSMIIIGYFAIYSIFCFNNKINNHF